MVVPVEALWVRRDLMAGWSVSRLPGLVAARRLPLGPPAGLAMPCTLCLSNDAELGEHGSSLKGAPMVLRGGRPHSCCSGQTSKQEDSLPETRDWASRSKDLIKTSCRVKETRREGRGRDSPGWDGRSREACLQGKLGTKSGCAPGSVLLAVR